MMIKKEDLIAPATLQAMVMANINRTAEIAEMQNDLMDKQDRHLQLMESFSDSLATLAKTVKRLTGKEGRDRGNVCRLRLVRG